MNHGNEPATGASQPYVAEAASWLFLRALLSAVAGGGALGLLLGLGFVLGMGLFGAAAGTLTGDVNTNELLAQAVDGGLVILTLAVFAMGVGAIGGAALGVPVAVAASLTFGITPRLPWPARRTLVAAGAAWAPIFLFREGQKATRGERSSSASWPASPSTFSPRVCGFSRRRADASK